jgi:hypothetical protein
MSPWRLFLFFSLFTDANTLVSSAKSLIMPSKYSVDCLSMKLSSKLLDALFDHLTWFGLCCLMPLSQSTLYFDGMIKLFADDTKVFASVNNEGDKNSLQGDIDKLMNWSDTWLLKFNKSL